MRGLSLVAASGGHSSLWCAGLSLSRPLLLRSTGSRRAGSVTVAHGPSCSAACGIFPDQGLNLCPLHWQADSQPLHHQGSPSFLFLMNIQMICNRNHLLVNEVLNFEGLFWLTDVNSAHVLLDICEGKMKQCCVCISVSVCLIKDSMSLYVCFYRMA